MISNYKKSLSGYWFICILYTMSIVVVDCFMPKIHQIMCSFDIRYNLAVLLIGIESLAFSMYFFWHLKNLLCFLFRGLRFYLAILFAFYPMHFSFTLRKIYYVVWQRTNPKLCIYLGFK